MRNIVLLNITGRDMASVGEAAAKAAGLKFRDVNKMILAASGLDADEIGSVLGKAGLRQMEASVYQALRSTSDSVIVTGDGAAESLGALRENGIAVLIDASPDLTDERLEVYRANADRTIVYSDEESAVRELCAIIEEQRGERETGAELEELYSELNETDSGLAKLFLQRLRLCDRLAAIKKSRGLPIDDESRDNAAFNSAIRCVTEDCYEETLGLMKTVLEISKYRQRKTLG